MARVGSGLVEPFAQLLNAQGSEGSLSLYHALHRIVLGFLAAEAQPSEPGNELIRKAMAQMARQDEEPLAIPALAARLGVSPATLNRHFRAEVGCRPRRLHAAAARIEEAEKLLAKGMSVTSVAYRLGFCSSQHFATTYRKLTNRKRPQAAKRIDHNVVHLRHESQPRARWD